MPVKFIDRDLRTYKVTCDACGEFAFMKTKNKTTLRDGMRYRDWSWRDLGILGIVELTCPECMKRRKNNGDQEAVS